MRTVSAIPVPQRVCRTAMLGFVLAAAPFGSSTATDSAPHLQTTFRQLAYHETQTLPRDRLDRDNQLALHHNAQVLESRPDLRLRAAPMDVRFQPRLTLRRRDWNTGIRSGQSETETEVFVRELRLSLTATETLFFALGREDVQWGPSFLLSPSNPFDPGTGRLDPKQESPTADFLRVLWIPVPAWSFALIANTGRARDTAARHFSPAYALKTDVFMGRFHGAAIGSKREGQGLRGGGFASWHAGEAFLLYGEAGNGRGAMSGLSGISYTTPWRWMLSAEYLYHHGGERHAPLSAMLPTPADLPETPPPRQLPFNTGANFNPQSSLPMLTDAPSRVAPSDLLAEFSLPIRKNYLLLQAACPHGLHRFDLVMQYLRNLDDHSGRFLVLAEYAIGAHTRFFAHGIVFHGDRDAEFGSLLREQIMAGFDFFF